MTSIHVECVQDLLVSYYTYILLVFKFTSISKSSMKDVLMTKDSYDWPKFVIFISYFREYRESLFTIVKTKSIVCARRYNYFVVTCHQRSYLNPRSNGLKCGTEVVNGGHTRVYSMNWREVESYSRHFLLIIVVNVIPNKIYNLFGCTFRESCHESYIFRTKYSIDDHSDSRCNLYKIKWWVIWHILV